MSYNIAIDGPAGAGKSTIAKAVAKKMNLIYVDTGAMYRAIGLYLLRNNINPQDAEAVNTRCQDADITIQYDKEEQVVCLNGENVNHFIRTEAVSKITSVISVQPSVRLKLLQLQQRLAAENDCIMDGRDIGTCVLPDAQVKIYLTASSSVRAKRRYEELMAKGESCDYETIKADIEERDHRDMHRETSPLKQAEDAILVDSSDLSIHQVIEKIIEICQEKR